MEGLMDGFSEERVNRAEVLPANSCLTYFSSHCPQLHLPVITYKSGVERGGTKVGVTEKGERSFFLPRLLIVTNSGLPY